MKNKIDTINDVTTFLRDVMFNNELIMGFNPDTPFEDYINTDTGKNLFSPAKAKKLDEQMNECFAVCAREKADIYEMALNLVKEFYTIEKAAGRPIPDFILADPDIATTEL